MSTAWMPPSLSDEDKQGFADAYPDDPHRAAAAAWESYAASLPVVPGEGATSVSTGAQSVSYGPLGGGEYGQAMARADWHRSRARVYSATIGPTVATTEGQADQRTVEPPIVAPTRVARYVGLDRIDEYGQEAAWHEGEIP